MTSFMTSPHVVRDNHDVAFSGLFLSEYVLINCWNKNEINHFLEVAIKAK